MRIGQHIFKPFESVCIIAEIASSHEGRVDLAMRLTEYAAQAGADCVKFQLFKADELLVPSHPKYQILNSLELRRDDWKKVFAHAQSLGICVIAEAYDEASLMFAQELGADAFKIPTSDLTDAFLLKRAAAAHTPLLLGVGGATRGEIDFAVKACEEVGNHTLILLHGFQSFPTRIEDSNMQLLSILLKDYPYETGFADHCDGELELAMYFPLIAVGLGATVIEKHITTDRSLKGRDYYSALNPDEFAAFVDLIRQVEQACMFRGFGVSEAEAAYRTLMKKKIVARRDIAEGGTITQEDICFRRTVEEGLTPEHCRQLLGKAKRTIKRHSCIVREDVDA